MEKFLIKSRIDCPPPETRQIIKEKDQIIQKLNEKLKYFELNVYNLLTEREILLNLFSKLSNILGHNTTLSSNYHNDRYIEQFIEQEFDFTLNSNTHKNHRAPQSTENVKLLTDTYMSHLEKQIDIAALIIQSKVDSLHSPIEQHIQVTTSTLGISSPTPPISSASSSSSSLTKQERLNELDEFDNQHNPTSTITTPNNYRLLNTKNINSSISSSMMLQSPKQMLMKKTLKNTVSTTNNSHGHTRNLDSTILDNNQTTTPLNGSSNLNNHRSNQSNNLTIKYELSNDLQQKEIEFLNRKYGGHLRARRAARIIQLAYREYKLRKNYIKLCENTLKRRSLDISANFGNSNNFDVNSRGNGQRNNSTKKMSIDLPSVDFEHLMEKMNKRDGMDECDENDEDSGNEERVGYRTSKNQQKSNRLMNNIENDLSTLSLMGSTNGDYKNLDDEEGNQHGLEDDEALDDFYENDNHLSLKNNKTLVNLNLNSVNSSSINSVYSTASASTSTCSSSTTTSSNKVSNTSNSSKIIDSNQAAIVVSETPKINANLNRSKLIKSNENSANLPQKSVNNYDLNKHKYLVGLNLFNRKPEKGINYLIDEKFLDRNSRIIAEFLFNRNCISKQMIGDYISNTQDKFIRMVLVEFINLIDLRHLPVDEALRKFQTHFRMPGEAQKIEHLTHAFSSRFIECNKAECKIMFNCADETVEVLAYAIILLNTSIHNPNVKPSEKMKFEQFLKMTKGIDNGNDIDKDYMHGIYERVKQNEFKSGKDHTNSVMEFEKSLVGAKKPTTLFALPHRRLVCIVQLYEVYDLTKKDKPNSHLHNENIFEKKNTTLYTYKYGLPLHGMNVVLFTTNHYQYGIRLIRMPEKKVLITFNAKNENDQQLFCRDLAESIAESNEIESIRIKTELEKYKPKSVNLINFNQNVTNGNANSNVNGNFGNTNIPNYNDHNGVSSKVSFANTNSTNNTNKPKNTKTLSTSSSSNSTVSSSSSSSSYYSAGKRVNTFKASVSSSLTSPVDKLINYQFKKTNTPVLDTALKRTLSNSLLDLGNPNPSQSAGNLRPNQLGSNLCRAGSECSIYTGSSSNNKMVKHRSKSWLINRNELVPIDQEIKNEKEKVQLEENIYVDIDAPEKLVISRAESQCLRKKDDSHLTENCDLVLFDKDLLDNELKQKEISSGPNKANRHSSSMFPTLTSTTTTTAVTNPNTAGTNSATKYFTISSAAGQKFRQIIKKYV